MINKISFIFYCNIFFCIVCSSASDLSGKILSVLSRPFSPLPYNAFERYGEMPRVLGIGTNLLWGGFLLQAIKEILNLDYMQSTSSYLKYSLRYLFFANIAATIFFKNEFIQKEGARDLSNVSTDGGTRTLYDIFKFLLDLFNNKTSNKIQLLSLGLLGIVSITPIVKDIHNLTQKDIDDNKKLHEILIKVYDFYDYVIKNLKNTLAANNQKNKLQPVFNKYSNAYTKLETLMKKEIKKLSFFEKYKVYLFITKTESLTINFFSILKQNSIFSSQVISGLYPEDKKKINKINGFLNAMNLKDQREVKDQVLHELSDL